MDGAANLRRSYHRSNSTFKLMRIQPLDLRLRSIQHHPHSLAGPQDPHRTLLNGNQLAAIESDHCFVRRWAANGMLEHFRIERMHIARDRHFTHALHDAFPIQGPKVEMLRGGCGSKKSRAGED